MTLTEGLTIAGLFAGPVAAILISLGAERRRELKVRRLEAVRVLLVGRLNFADPNFQRAINTIPVDFAGHDGVLSALDAYLAAVAVQLPKDDEAGARVVQNSWGIALETLATALLVSIGYSERSAAQFVRSPYRSSASGQMWEMQTGALRAVVDVATNTGRLADINQRMLDRMLGPGPEEPDNK